MGLSVSEPVRLGGESAPVDLGRNKKQLLLVDEVGSCFIVIIE